MIKRLLTAAATVALLSAGAAWAQTSSNVGVGTNAGASVGTGGTSLDTKDQAGAAIKKERGGATMDSSGSTGVGAGSSSGIGATTGSSSAVGVKPGGLSGDANTNTGAKVLGK